MWKKPSLAFGHLFFRLFFGSGDTPKR